MFGRFSLIGLAIFAVAAVPKDDPGTTRSVDSKVLIGTWRFEQVVEDGRPLLPKEFQDWQLTISDDPKNDFPCSISLTKGGVNEFRFLSTWLNLIDPQRATIDISFLGPQANYVKKGNELTIWGPERYVMTYYDSSLGRERRSGRYVWVLRRTTERVK